MSVITSSVNKAGDTTWFWESIVKPTVYKRYGKLCFRCGSTKHLDVHHEDYDRQTLDNLKPLCRSCHVLLHLQEKKERI